jgi:threonine dehydrogenase-like Zn-dependent dehydrogenase
VRVPDEVDLDIAAVAEPLAVAVRAARRVEDRDYPVIIAGAGSIGTLLACVLRARRGDALPIQIFDVAPERARLAARLSGADAVLEPEERKSGEAQPLVAFECTGTSRGLNGLIEALPASSLIVLVGVHGHQTPTDLHRVLHKEIEIRASLSHSRGDFASAVSMLPELATSIARLITHRIRFGDVPEMLHSLTVGQTEAIKVLAGPGEARPTRTEITDLVDPLRPSST